VTKALYLGRDAATQERVELSPDLFTTHGVLLGMTGSGKTGLALGLLEEMVEAGIPVIAIDPKGDLPNLALLFPEFSTADFSAWTDPAEAQRAGVALDVLAAEKAQKWKSGLSDWGLNALNVARLKTKLDLRILTPGSSVGRPVNLLGDFQPPGGGDLDPEVRADLAGGIISGLLSLVEKDVDPLRDPRHVLLVAILCFTWDKGAPLSLEDLITHLVDPPFPKVGVFPVDRFLSPDDRMKLALQLNNLVASPGFAAWKQGESLDIGALMTSADGRTPVNLFYLSHLDEKERQFFVGRLMNQVLSWSRTLTGSASLRALVYFDEVAGYLPPYPASPASKAPILTMLKQSRAVGVGLCLATQNPVDLDYKALSNIGTWMIGRLQTQQDRERVRDGLISASGGLSSAQLDDEFSKLQARSFLLRTPSSERPCVLQTRWAMSYLRGPITLQELKNLPQSGSAPGNVATTGTVASVEKPTGAAERATPPPVPKGFGQSFIDPRYVFGTHHGGAFEPHKQASRADGTVLFEPALRATLKLQFSESKESFVWHQVHHYVAFPLRDTRDATKLFVSVPLETEHLLTQPPSDGRFTGLPDAFDQTEELAEAQKALVDHLYRNLTATRYINKEVQLYSRPEETQDQFLARCHEAAENLEDQAAVKLRLKLQAKIDRVEQQMAKTKDRVERLSQSATGKKIEGLWNAGEMLLSMFSKRKKSFSTVLNKSRQAAEASTKSTQAEGELERLQQDILALQQEMEIALGDLDAEFAAKAGAVESTEIRLARKDIVVDIFEVLWVPVSSRI
jgi:DNA helicase HerA-like ATPase